MKRLYNALKIILSLLILAFAGYSAFQSWHFYAHRDMYAVTSAPWYYTIIFAGVITAVVGVIIIIALAIVKKRIK